VLRESPHRTYDIVSIFFPPEGEVGLLPKRGCLLTLAYYAFPRRYEFGERRWNDIDRGKPEEFGEKPVPVPLCPPNTIWIDPGANPGIRGIRPATNDLSRGKRPQSARLTL
jgi:hypothetical protein